MLIAKFKGLVTGLTLATVVTTGIGVLAQSPGGHPDGDRLGALERKLDRILEALGGSHGDAPPPLAKIHVDGGRAKVDRIPQPPPVPTPLAHPSSDRAPSVPPPPPAPGAPVPAPLAGPSHDLAPAAPEAAPLVGPSHDLAARVDSLERRLAAMERRLGEMEHRWSRPAQPAGAGPSLYGVGTSSNGNRLGNFSQPRLSALPSLDTTASPKDKGPGTED
jgi:hypothetical protein